MCMLCVIQKWSRRVATMLPWLVIPLIGLWALSQLLPPAFRFEITSPRLACVFVLLVTLFWYEILMPQLSSWRVRRNARLKERERLEAIRFDKLRKTAIRRCRNCLTPYRDQSPAGGRFMCSYCGHISKRPVLEMPETLGMRLSDSGITKDSVAKCGKAWSEHCRICRQDLFENGNWFDGFLVGSSSNCWWRNRWSFFPGDNQCLSQKSYLGLVFLACKLLAAFFLGMRWIWKKIFRISMLSDENSLEADCSGMLVKQADSGANFPESRVEKARRKAEEKRQARLEKELLEEDERKQREEVARLVEERRKLRDEKTGADKDRGKGSISVKESDSKKDMDRKRRERKKEKGSNRSDSDAEDHEKKTGKEKEKKHELDRKCEIGQREQQRTGTPNFKVHGMEVVNGLKGSTPNKIGKGNTGARYLDRMKGSFLSPKASSKESFFTKDPSVGATAAATATAPAAATATAPAAATAASKESRSSGLSDHYQYSSSKGDLSVPEHFTEKPNMGRDDRSIHHPVQPMTTLKKSWQQLFTNSLDSPSPSTTNAISRPRELNSQAPLARSFDNPINFGLPSLFNVSIAPNRPPCSSAGYPSAIFPISSPPGGELRDFLPEEPDIFEDPCYEPDPVSLLGPVSESLDNFQLDMGADLSASSKMGRQSPMSMLQISDERNGSSNRFLGRTWEMWNSSPLVQDGLGWRPHRTFLAQEDVVPCQNQNGAVIKPLSAGMESHLTIKPEDVTAHSRVAYTSPRATMANHLFDTSSDDTWPNLGWGVEVSSEDGGRSRCVAGPAMGGLDVQSVWGGEMKK